MISIPQDKIELQVERQAEQRTYVEQLPGEIQRKIAGCCIDTHATWQFSRNGHYERGLSTRWGLISFAMPQLACECGGSVRVQYQTVRPRQPVWDDVADVPFTNCAISGKTW